ncbi:hypothetical protein ACHAWF_000926, partial [Thalassiosira exigua]
MATKAKVERRAGRGFLLVIALLFAACYLVLLKLSRAPLFSSTQGNVRARLRWKTSVATTGMRFRGEKTREFAGPMKFDDDWELRDGPSRSSGATETSCRRWNVVTTIFEPSDAVRRAALLRGWCTVIVADRKTPENYVETAGLGGQDGVHFLSIDEQERWAEETGVAVAGFVSSTPYDHFARKNIGYLYAIYHGAFVVFDFDDDNMLIEGAELLENETHLEGTRVAVVGPNTFNHHPMMGASIPTSWPRGFPLDRIKSTETWGIDEYAVESVPMESIAVMQYVVDGDPDIDAVHRLVHPLPMKFTFSSERDENILVPPHSFAPYNAQATLHTQNALWALYLPSTVPGR